MHPRLKHATIRWYARNRRLKVFVETGTSSGDTVAAVSGLFRQIYTIELAVDLWDRARRRFEGDTHITVIQGDSGKRLEDVLRAINEPCCFWLDGHYSGGTTARGELDSPVLKELAWISKHVLRHQHVILIDDAREFRGAGGYPTLEELDTLVRESGFNSLSVKNDIIRILNTHDVRRA
jgi:hypothetical protein